MAKGRRSDGPSQRGPVNSIAERQAPRKIVEGLQEAERLVQAGATVEAAVLLDALHKQYPQSEDVLIELVNVNITLKDSLALIDACEKLVKLAPRMPEPRVTLAGAYLQLACPGLALRQFGDFLKLFPKHPLAENVRDTVAGLEPETRSQLAAMGLAGPDTMELGRKYERLQLCTTRQETVEGYRIAAEMIRARPDFAPAYNNLSLLQFERGESDAAMSTARKVLVMRPQNFHALSNLVRFQVMTGMFSEARQTAANLQAIADNGDTSLPMKQAEAFSLLGDDQTVLAVVNKADKKDNNFKQAIPHAALFWHLGAVAAHRLGDEKRAGKLWKRSLEAQPGFQLATDNLNDIALPVGEQHGAWPYTINYWLRRPIIADIVRNFQAAGKRRSSDMDDNLPDETVLALFAKHPALLVLIPMLLERGDQNTRDLALALVSRGKTPALLAAVRDFALSRNGSDKLRMRAATMARRAGLLEHGPMRMWSSGKWRELRLMGFEISGEPFDYMHSPEVSRMNEEAHELLSKRRAKDAERMLVDALRLEPESPDLLNNLSVAYEFQSRFSEACALIAEIHRRFPDYLFARTSLATICAREGNFDKARALLEPLGTRTKFHTSEYSAFARANFELALAQGELEGARATIEMLETVRDHDSSLPDMRARLREAQRTKQPPGSWVVAGI